MTAHSMPLHELSPDGLCEFLRQRDTRLGPTAHVLHEHGISGRQLMGLSAQDLEMLGIPLQYAMAVIVQAYGRLQEHASYYRGARGLEHMQVRQAG